MERSTLRLRVDAPYPGESMSSFVGRAAQFYAMPVHVLLAQLMSGQKWTSGGRRDIDLNPPSALERRLAESVKDWHSPLAEHQGFCSWTLAPACRNAYCPTCFEEDLDVGRIPYFRNDWIPVFVVTCWSHGTPLFSWEDVDGAGRRRLPKAWLYDHNHRLAAGPAFFHHHRGQLGRLMDQPLRDLGPEHDSYDPLRYLAGLQAAVEKRSTDAMPPCGRGKDARVALRSLVSDLVSNSARYLTGRYESPIAMTACPQGLDGWFEPMPSAVRRRNWKFSESGLRQTKQLGWRRTYLLFAARSLAGTDRFGYLIDPISTVRASWRTWWQRDLFPHMGQEQRATLEWLTATWGRLLDEPA